MAKLTPKQQRFTEEYLIDLNATQAAIRAGYSEKSAARIGAELLHKTQVAQAIAEAMRRRASRTELTQDAVLCELQKVAFRDAADYAESDLKYANKLKALELLGKHLGLFTDRLELATPAPIQIEVDYGQEIEDEPGTDCV